MNEKAEPEGRPAVEPAGVERVRFDSGGEEVVGALHRPAGGGPHPVVVLAHGFGATRAARLDRYAARFREAGFLALAFDYRHFGESGGSPRQLLSIRRQLEDWRAAVGFARGLPGADADRVALWGTSFSGGHVVRVAADDPRIAAVVAQVPFMDGIETTLRLHPLSSVRVTGLALLDLARSALGLEPTRIPLVGPPGAAAAMALEEAVDGFERLYAEAPEWDERVCARVGLAVPLYRPVRFAARVRCPLLVQAGERDVLTPPGGARKAARRAPRGELREYSAGHFDVYFGELHERVVGEQVAFLRRHLGATGARAG